MLVNKAVVALAASYREMRRRPPRWKVPASRSCQGHEEQRNGAQRPHGRTVHRIESSHRLLVIGNSEGTTTIRRTGPRVLVALTSTLDVTAIQWPVEL